MDAFMENDDECWDDDADIQGPLHMRAVSTTTTATRASSRSGSFSVDESDRDFHVSVSSEAGELSTQHAIERAHNAGIPIPTNVPASALFSGGTIKKLGGKRIVKALIDDWSEDLELPKNTLIDTTALKTSISNIERLDDDFDADFHGGSSTTAFSPPSPPKMKENVPPKLTEDDFTADLDFGDGDVFDTRKLTLNRNVKVKKPPKPASPTRRTGTTLTFTKPTTATSRIPKLATSTRPRLETVAEAGALPKPLTSRTGSTNIPLTAPPTPSRRLQHKTSRGDLRPKTPDRSGAISSLGGVGVTSARKPPIPFLPAGTSHAQSHHVSTKLSTRRRPGSSDSNEAPINRPISRLSNPHHRPVTPTHRKDIAPPSLVREAAAKRTLTKPTRRRAFGDGTELEAFDDLLTSTSVESKFVKQPVARGLPRAANVRSTLLSPSTPATPQKTLKHTPSTPRFARETNASRARIGTSLAPIRERENPPAPTSARKGPALITNVGRAPGVQVSNGMVFDPANYTWLTMSGGVSGNNSPSRSVEDDVFAGIEDLHDGPTTRAPEKVQWVVGEEFDVGPEFVRRQREEEGVWRRIVAPWVGGSRGDEYKYGIRDMVLNGLA